MTNSKDATSEPAYLQLAQSKQKKHLAAYGKNDINALLWKYVHQSTTIAEANLMACEIYSMIEKTWYIE